MYVRWGGNPEIISYQDDEIALTIQPTYCLSFFHHSRKWYVSAICHVISHSVCAKCVARSNDRNWIYTTYSVCILACCVVSCTMVDFFLLHGDVWLITVVRLWKWYEAYRRGLATIMNRQICALNIQRLRPFCFASSHTIIEIVYWSESSRMRITKYRRRE